MSQNEQLIRMILEPKSIERLDRIRISNKQKAESIEKEILERFHRLRARISDEQFVEIIQSLDRNKAKTQIFYQRKRNDADLEEIE